LPTDRPPDECRGEEEELPYGSDFQNAGLLVEALQAASSASQRKLLWQNLQVMALTNLEQFVCSASYVVTRERVAQLFPERAVHDWAARGFILVMESPIYLWQARDCIANLPVEYPILCCDRAHLLGQTVNTFRDLFLFMFHLLSDVLLLYRLQPEQDEVQCLVDVEVAHLCVNLTSRQRALLDDSMEESGCDETEIKLTESQDSQIEEASLSACGWVAEEPAARSFWKEARESDRVKLTIREVGALARTDEETRVDEKFCTDAQARTGAQSHADGRPCEQARTGTQTRADDEQRNLPHEIARVAAGLTESEAGVPSPAKAPLAVALEQQEQTRSVEQARAGKQPRGDRQSRAGEQALVDKQTHADDQSREAEQCDASGQARAGKRLKPKNRSQHTMLEVFGGVGAFSLAMALFAFVTIGCIENNSICHDLLHHQHPNAHMARDFYDAEWKQWPIGSVRLVTGGPSCTPYSKAGRQLHDRHPASTQVSDMSQVAERFNPDLVWMENVVALLDCGAVLRKADASFAACGYKRSLTLIVDHEKEGGDTIRIRVLLIYEKERRVAMLPPLEVPLQGRSSAGIREHLIALDEVPNDMWLTGAYCPLREASQRRPPIVGRLRWGGPHSKLERGSLVRLTFATGEWRVMELLQDGRIEVMRNCRRYPTKKWIRKKHIKAALWQDIAVYSIDAPSKSVRAFGEWPVRTVQLCHDSRKCGKCDRDCDGSSSCVRALHPRETWSLQQLPCELYAKAVELGADQDQLYRCAGNSIPQHILRATAEVIAQRLDAIDAAHTLRLLPHPGRPTAVALAVRTVLVVSAAEGRRYKHRKTVYFLETHEGDKLHFPQVASTKTCTREQSVAAARNMLPEELIGELHPYLAGEYRSEDGTVRIVVLPIQERLPLLGLWCSIDELLDDELIEAALTAQLAVDKYQVHPQPTRKQSTEALKFHSGARPSKRVKRSEIAATLKPRDWQALKQRTHDHEKQLEQALRADDEDRAYLTQWADRISVRPLSEDVPPELRQMQGDYRDPQLASVPFASRCYPPVTEPVSLPTPQTPPPGFKPHSLRDLVEDVVLDELIPNFVRQQLEDLHAYRRDGPAAVRNFNRVLAIGQDLFKPAARGIIWDLRDWHQGGEIKPLAPDEPIETHFNLEYLRDEMRDFPDQELASFIADGVQFHADIELQLCFMPHLTSLKYGIESVASELKKLAEKGWYGLFENIPFLPCRVQPQGAVPRKLEERWRRVMEAGAPRKPVYDTAGISVVPLNEASKGVKSHRRSATGNTDLGSAGEAAQQPHQWPPELKPRISDYARDGAVLRHVADQAGEPVFAFGDDLSNMFHQFRLASSEYWKVCVLYDPILPEHRHHTWAVEYVLAMGLFQSSNIAQRFAHFLVALFRKEADLIEDELDDDEGPAVQGWRKHRRGLPEHAHFRQDRLFAVHMYTDDIIVICVSVQRAVRLLKVWHRVIKNVNILMAIPEKRHIGCSVEALGAILHFDAGILCIPQIKALRALENLNRLLQGQLEMAEYRSLLGLLEHFVCLNAARRNVMYGMWDPFGSTFPRLGPTDLYVPDQLVVKQSRNWQQFLLSCRGCHFFSALPDASRPAGQSVHFHVFSDAALEGAAIPSLGGYFHGYWWTLPLTEAQKHIPIPHLEFSAAVISLVLFVRTFLSQVTEIPRDMQITMHVDGLATPFRLTDAAGTSRVMQFIHMYFMELPEYKFVEHVLQAEHAYGEFNVLADAASRGYFKLLHVLCQQQLGISPILLDVPDDLAHFVNAVLGCYRTTQ